MPEPTTDPAQEETDFIQQVLQEAPSFTWKRFLDGTELRCLMIAPDDHTPSAAAPAVVFLFGGMWALEYSPEFISWAVHLSDRGIVCLIPEYRTHARFDVKAGDIIADGLDIWKWVHHNAGNLGIDRGRITLAGTDAGGLMALNAAMQPLLYKKKWWEFGKRDVPPLQPACVAIFRGIVDATAPEARTLRVAEEVSDPQSVNPCALLRSHLPALFCAHGMLDPLLDFEMRQWFCDQWEAQGNIAECLLCPNGDHTLTHFEVNPTVFEQVLLAWETFMVDTGIWPKSEVKIDALMG